MNKNTNMNKKNREINGEDFVNDSEKIDTFKIMSTIQNVSQQPFSNSNLSHYSEF